jgi:hypothetical protein
MSERAREFVARWVANNVPVGQPDPEGDNTRARALAPMLLEDAQAAGVPRTEIEVATGDVVSYLAERINAGS